MLANFGIQYRAVVDGKTDTFKYQIIQFPAAAIVEHAKCNDSVGLSGTAQMHGDHGPVLCPPLLDVGDGHTVSGIEQEVAIADDNFHCCADQEFGENLNELLTLAGAGRFPVLADNQFGEFADIQMRQQLGPQQLADHIIDRSVMAEMR